MKPSCSQRDPAAHQGSNPRQQLLKGKWLGQVIVGPRVQSAHSVRDRVASGQEQHGRVTHPPGETAAESSSHPGREATSPAKPGPIPPTAANSRPSPRRLHARPHSLPHADHEPRKSAIFASSSTTSIRMLTIHLRSYSMQDHAHAPSDLSTTYIDVARQLDLARQPLARALPECRGHSRWQSSGIAVRKRRVLDRQPDSRFFDLPTACAPVLTTCLP